MKPPLRFFLSGTSAAFSLFFSAAFPGAAAAGAAVLPSGSFGAGPGRGACAAPAPAFWASATWAPQRGQNRLSGSSAVPHIGQNLAMSSLLFPFIGQPARGACRKPAILQCLFISSGRCTADGSCCPAAPAFRQSSDTTPQTHRNPRREYENRRAPPAAPACRPFRRS